MEQSDAQEVAATVIWEGFCERMGGQWSGKDGSMASELCWQAAGEILRRIQFPSSQALTAARIEGERLGLERAIERLEKRAENSISRSTEYQIRMDIKAIRALAKELTP